jgi:hypothetical protein
MVINSSLMTLFVKMLTVFKSAELKVNLLKVMALLLRFATYIANELADSGVVKVLAELLHDKNVAIRKRALCALGELLFYIATQKQEDGVDAAETKDGVFGAWIVTPATLRLVQNCLRPDEDDIVRHYAVKTIENIFSQCPSEPAWFTSSDVLFGLLAVYTDTKVANLSVSAASAMSLLLRREPSLLPKLLDRVGYDMIVDALDVRNVKLQQAFLNILNLALVHEVPRVESQLAKHAHFPGSLLKILAATSTEEGEKGASAPSGTSSPALQGAAATRSARTARALKIAHTVVQGKVLLTVCLLSSAFGLKWFVECCAASESRHEHGLAALVDRIKKQPSQYSYLSSCVKYMVESVVPHLARPVLRKTTSVLTRIAKRANPTPELTKELDSVLRTFPFLEAVMASGTFRQGLEQLPLAWHFSQHLRLLAKVAYHNTECSFYCRSAQ